MENVKMTYNSVPVDSRNERVEEPLGNIIDEIRDAQFETVAVLAEIMNILHGEQINAPKQPDIKCFVDACTLNRELAFCARGLARKIREAFGG